MVELYLHSPIYRHSIVFTYKVKRKNNVIFTAYAFLFTAKVPSKIKFPLCLTN
jgi:hypothetical protein